MERLSFVLRCLNTVFTDAKQKSIRRERNGSPVVLLMFNLTVREITVCLAYFNWLKGLVHCQNWWHYNLLFVMNNVFVFSFDFSFKRQIIRRFISGCWSIFQASGRTCRMINCIINAIVCKLFNCLWDNFMQLIIHFDVLRGWTFFSDIKEFSR